MPTLHEDNNDHFRAFAASLAQSIDRRGGPPPDAEARFVAQKTQMERLIAAEEKFRQKLIAHPRGPAAYEAFVRYVRVERHNILIARPFFRTRQQLFTDLIAPAFKADDSIRIQQFPINYLFVRFIVRLRRWDADTRRAAAAVRNYRMAFVEDNLPLAISRARLFFARTPRSHLTYMDLVQAAAEGLMAAVDKYVLPETGFSTSFRSVACGRMTGNFIDDYSETPLHFFADDRRRIYRANKCLGRSGGEVDFDELADQVNKLGEDKKDRVTTTSAEIAGLLAAASMVSFDPVVSPDAPSSAVGTWAAAPHSTRPDTQVEDAEARRAVVSAIAGLSVLQRKVLRLRGVTFE